MSPTITSAPVVHLELHTGDLPAAHELCVELCGWRAESIQAGQGSYLALDLGRGVGGGIVECDSARSLWLPYVEVEAIGAATDRACALGASVLLEPREGPAGWRSVVATAAGAELAFRQRRREGTHAAAAQGAARGGLLRRAARARTAPGRDRSCGPRDR